MKQEKLISLFILITLTIHGFAQNTNEIFAEGKEFIYQVIFIETNGDTLTNEKMILLGKDEEWKFQKTQTILEIKYFPDTVNLKEYVDPRDAYQKRRVKNLKKKAKGKKGWDNYTWIDNGEVTGKVITDSSIWIHPPRSNQYGYHFMNAYPQVFFNKLYTGGGWQSRLKIMSGYPSNEEFVGTTINTFEVTEKLTTTFNEKTLNDCWRIEITSVHSTKGETSSEYIFSESHGFLKMNHVFYDGVKINYILKDIIIKESVKD